MDNLSDQNSPEIKKKILIAEDDEEMAYMMQNALKDLGHEVKVVYDGAAAIHEYTINPPDLIILDIIMEKASGLEVAAHIRSNDKLTPIFLHSAKTSSEDVLEGLSIGVDDYLRKPTNIEELKLKVRNFLKKPQPKYNKGWYRLGDLEINFYESKVRCKNKETILQEMIKDVLWELYTNMHEVYPTRIMINKIWGAYNNQNEGNLRVVISKLKEVLKMDPKCQIVNSRAKGYRLITVSKQKELS
ncbi:response regulator transcription factor [Arthrospiribacter ruber]|uniref:DNA-binding response regulator n=1 Tax=Arthrospiribacter ruber TaxID=2487934 RepID=A0A951MAX2_9BACT|nr:response regulator transcription factor [Arthrospiribacter ruber]MBW3466854.1 DNA-binding response regulator [Arthrospiribacter ruber]